MKNKRADRRKGKSVSAGPAVQSSAPAAPIKSLGTLPGWMVLALLAVLTITFLGDVFFAGKTLAMRDTFCDFLPWRLFAAKVFASGHIPLWNPFSGYGKPFAADPQAAVFYPPHLLFSLLPAVWALKISWALHLWIAAASMYGLARYWGLRTVPALIAAIGFAFSTLIMAYLEFFSEFTTVVWGPLVLLLVSRLLDRCQAPVRPEIREQLRHIALLALVLAVQFLAGHPESFLQTLLMSGVLIALRCVYLRNPLAFARVCLGCLCAGILALLLVLPQFLATWELIHHSERASAVDPGLDVASVHPRQLFGLFLPFLFGRPGYPDEYWARTIFEFWAGTCYVGILPLILGAFALIYLRHRDRQKTFLVLFALALLLFGLLMAAGRYTPLYQFVFDHVPLLNRARWPGKYLLWVPYGLTLLAGLGYQTFIDLADHLRTPKIRRLIIAVGILILGVLGGGCALAHSSPNFLAWLAGTQFPPSSPHVQDILADYHLALLFLTLSLAVVIARLYRAATAWLDALAVGLLFLNLLVISRQVQPALNDSVYRPKSEYPLAKAINPQAGRVLSAYSSVQQWLYGSHDEKLFDWAQLAGAGDAWLPFGIYQCWQGGMKLDRYKTFQWRMYEAKAGEAARLGEIAGVRYFVRGEKMDKILWDHAPKVVGVQELPHSLPRAYLLTHWVTVSNAANIMPLLVSPAFDPWREAVLESPTKAGQTIDASVPAAPMTPPETAVGITTLKDNLNSLQLGDVSVKQKSLLVVADAWYPGWQVTVDGQPEPIYRANYLFRGVFLEPGMHQVRFFYEPWQFVRGGWASGLAAIGLTILIAMSFRKPKPASTASGQ